MKDHIIRNMCSQFGTYRGIALLRRKKKGGRVVTSGQFFWNMGLPGRVDTSGTKTTTKTWEIVDM